jgi:hypothetical protein
VTSWLLDTNIVSQLAPDKDGRPKAPKALGEWLLRNADQLYLSALSVVEIKAGIEKLRRAGGEHRALDLDGWLDRILTMYGERILSLDADVAKIAGVLTEEARANGSHPGLSDVLIAATAQAHDHGLLTDNMRHFAPLRLSIRLLNPLQSNLPATD